MLFGPEPSLCGHRGSGRGVVEGHRENTLGSFRAAVDAGVGWIEVDARVTADDVLVARHDPIAEDGRFVSELPAHETDALGIMRVADLLEEMPREIGVDIDIKTSLEDALRPRELTTAALVAGLVAQRGGGRPLLLTSFDPAALLIARERVPGVPVGLLTWMRFPLRKAIAAAVHLGVEVVAPHATSFPLEPADGPAVERPLGRSLEVAHEAGLQVLGWGGRPSQTGALLDAGVDCVVVDDVPATVRGYRASRPKRSRSRW